MNVNAMQRELYNVPIIGVTKREDLMKLYDAKGNVISDLRYVGEDIGGYDDISKNSNPSSINYNPLKDTMKMLDVDEDGKPIKKNGRHNFLKNLGLCAAGALLALNFYAMECKEKGDRFFSHFSILLFRHSLY